METSLLSAPALAARASVDGALLLGACSLSGRCWAGSLWLFKDPCAAPSEGFCSAAQTEAGVAGLPGLGTGILVASDSGAVELWELDKNQTLIVSEFCKYEHDDIMSTVSVLSSGTQVAKTSAHSEQVTCVTASPHKDSMFLLCGQQNFTLGYPLSQASITDGLTASGYLPTSLAWHPQQSEVFVFGVESGTVSLVNTKSAKCALSSAVHSCVTGLVFAPRRIPFLATISEDCSLAVLDSGLSEVFRSQAHRDFVRDATWSPLNHSLLTTVGWDHQVIHHILPTEPLAALGPKSVSE